MRAHVAALLLALALPAQDGTPDESPPAVELPGDLRSALEAIESLREDGELEAARRRLTEVVDGEPYARLLERELAVVEIGLARLDAAAKSLDALETLRRIREEVVAMLAALPDVDESILVSARQNLAVVRKQLGDLEGAHELFEYVHEARERLLPADHLELVSAKENLAVTRLDLGDLAGAHELFEHVHAARERLLPADHQDLLQAKLNLATTRGAQNDLEGALELEEYVHSARSRLLPEDHPRLLQAEFNMAATRYQLGDLEGARELFERVHAAFQQRLPDDHPHLLGAKLNLAIARKNLGDVAGALELEEYALGIRERLLSEDHPDLLLARQNVAVSRKMLGDLQGGLELERSVLEARRRLLPDDHPLVLAAAQNLAVTHYDLGDLESAGRLFDQVHTARRRLPEHHTDLLSTQLNLAVLRRHLGDLDGARELLEHVHAVRARLLPEDHPRQLTARHLLAATRRDLGDVEGTLAVTRELLSGQLARAAALRTESPRVARAGALVELRRLPVALYASELASGEDRGPLEARLFLVLEALRTVSTASSEATMAASRFPELRAARDRVAHARRELNALSLAPPEDPAGVEEWRAQLLELSEERDALERVLRSELARHGIVQTPGVGAIAGGLDKSSVLVSLFRYSRALHPDTESGTAPHPVDSLLAFVAEHDSTVRRIELGPASPIEELVFAWRERIGKPLVGEATVASRAAGSGRGTGLPTHRVTREDERAVGSALREKLVDPVLAALGDPPPAAIHFVLDDFLHLAPVDALPWGVDRRLGDAFAIRLETSVRRLAAPSPPVSGSGTLVAVGGVDFDATDAPARLARVSTPPLGSASDRKGAPGSFERLEHTGAEVEALAELYAHHGDEDPVVLLGSATSKGALHRLAPTARFLHVATHGWFAPEAFASMIDSAEEQWERDSFHRAEGAVVGFVPESLCGLALAGANRGVDELGKVPGILTAEELATLDLSDCELAVLSACETNVGIRRAGQGIQSLQSALHAAGARTAVTSLWRVDDAATRRLMELFYGRLWEGGLGKADALWQAKMALSAEGHPLRDWAGWVLTGNPD